MVARASGGELVNFRNVEFLLSAHALRQVPPPSLPDIAFAGRSNVGKSSLINKVIDRTSMVKTSSKPGKTQSLNFFLIDQAVHFVDLPGYGFARVSQEMRRSWQGLITEYIENRANLVCVVVIIDLRHELKSLDRELIDWLRFCKRAFLPVYTKADKLSRNNQFKNAAILDAGLGLTVADRVVFSAETGQGCDELRQRLAAYAMSAASGKDEGGGPPPEELLI